MSDKKKALEIALSTIEKQFGKGSIMRLGDSPNKLHVDVIPTGILTVDLALGIGGVPRGRVVEIYGPESSGKTTVALHIIAEAQKAGGVAAFIDVEHALDPIYAKKLGADTDNLLISQPDTGEQALEIAEALVRSGAVDIVVIDSVAALVPRAEIEGEMGDNHVGLQARLMSQALRKLTGAISKSNTTTIFINQIREKVGVMFGNPEITPGGRALKFYSSVRMEVRRVETLKQGTEMIGNRTRIKVVKNKLAPPFKQAEFDIIYGEGISREGAIIDLATDMEILAKSGAWYSYNNNRVGQGRENVKQYLKEHPETANEIETKVRANFITNTSVPPTTTTDDVAGGIMTADYLSQAVKKLRYRSYSSLEIKKYLISLGTSVIEADSVIERLTELAYLDDNKLAREICHSYRRAVKPCGHLFWSAKLKQRGIDSEIIAQLVAECSAQEEYSKAQELAAHYLKVNGKRTPSQQLRGLASLLARRGFTSETVAKILSEQQERY